MDDLTCGTGHGNARGVLVRCQRGGLKSTTGTYQNYNRNYVTRLSQNLKAKLLFLCLELISVLTGVQLEKQLDSEVVEVTAVLNDLDEGSQPTLS